MWLGNQPLAGRCSGVYGAVAPTADPHTEQ